MKRLVITVGLLGFVLYAGDYARVRYRMAKGRNALGTVQISRYYAIAQKNNRVEYDYGDSMNQDCVNSLFPHLGDSPCWYLNRHKVVQVDE